MSENKLLKPEVIVFAGPNGSGKTTITKMARTVGDYINADDIKIATLCTDMEAALQAEKLRNAAIDEHKDFTFETVLSTDRNLKLLQRAKDEGYFIRAIYVLTAMPEVNITRVNVRSASGGHSVPIDKIISRDTKALALIPQLVEISDIVHIYDNTIEPFRIFKKRKDIYYHWENEFWNYEKIQQLTGKSDYTN